VKKLDRTTITGLLFLFPAALYWGAMLREIFLPDVANTLVQKIGYALFPWGIIITGTCGGLCIGIIKRNRIVRWLAMILTGGFSGLWFLYAGSLQDWQFGFYDFILIGYPLLLVVVLNLPSVRDAFKKGRER